MSLQNLFIAKLPRNLTDADLLHIFAEYKPTSAKVMLDAATGKSKGFGFVLFPSEEEGKVAYKALNRKSTRACGHNFTLVIYPSNHDGKVANEPSNALYIRNIPITVTQECVEQFLRSFGHLTYCAMREDHYGSPVWVVYAEYETIDEAKNALNRLHGNSTFFHGVAPILAKFEDSDDAKRQRRRRREGAVVSGGGGSAGGCSQGAQSPPQTASSASLAPSPSVTIETASGNPARGAVRGATSHPGFQVPGGRTGEGATPVALKKAPVSNAGGVETLHAMSAPSPRVGYVVPQAMQSLTPSTSLVEVGTRPYSLSYNGADSIPTVHSVSSAGSLAQQVKLHPSSPPPYGFGAGPLDMTSLDRQLPLPPPPPPPQLQPPIVVQPAPAPAMVELKPFVVNAPSPQFCYTVGEKPVPVFVTGPMPSSPLLSGTSVLQSTPGTATTSAVPGDMSGGVHLLNPQPQNTVVLREGSQPFVFTKDVVNLHRQSLAAVTPITMLVPSEPARQVSALSPPTNIVLSASSSPEALPGGFQTVTARMGGQERPTQMILMANTQGFSTLV